MKITQLWRYPVKSMQGESLTTAEVDERGIRGDRQWGVLDVASGLTLTARREPKLFYASAQYLLETDDVQITLPDGATDLSAWLGYEVRLVRAGTGVSGRFEIAADFEAEDRSEWISWDGPEATFHDSGKTAVSVLSTGSMGAWDVRRFRGNVIVEAGLDEEQALVKRSVRLGTVEARGTKAISRCVLTTRPQPGGIERDLDVLRTINRDRAGNLGLSLVVTSPGTVSVGDSVVAVD